MKKLISLLLALMLALSSVAVLADEITVTGKVSEIEKYGHALLDVTIADFFAAGFALGDVVSVKAGTYEGDMPFFNGYYVDNGGYMVRAYPSHEYIAVCINYGKFAETAGVGVGDEVTITLKEKAGALDVQVMHALVYTNDRADYASDEIFANFRMVKTGLIGEGKLYRSASPINNENNRAAISNALVEAAGIKSVMNMADNAEEIAEYMAAEDFHSAYYKGLYDAGRVITLSMPATYAAPEFAGLVVQGLTFLAGQEAPYLVHCTEGKDRAGFGSMVLAALMGATKEELVADYMISYANYYGVDAASDPEKYNMIAEKNVVDMFRTVAGDAADRETIAANTEQWLLANGMAQEAIDALKANLK